MCSSNVTFYPRTSYFDRENELSAVDTFRGFYTLFWIFAAMMVVRTASDSYSINGTILGLTFGKLISKDGLVLALSDLVLVSSTFISYFYIKLILKGWLKYNSFGIGLQHFIQGFFLAIPVLWAFQRCGVLFTNVYFFN